MSIRREIRRITNEGPRPFGCPVTVVAVRELTPGFSRVTVEGAGLSDYREPLPADAFKLLLPPDGAGAVDFPERGADGLPYWPAGTQRPALRAFTVRRFDPARSRLDFDVALHADGLAITWLARIRPGEVIGLSGMRRDFVAGAGVRRHLVVGDASALPAISTIIESLDPVTPATAYVALTHDADRALAPHRNHVDTHWVGAGELARTVRTREQPGERTQVWVAGEAAAVRDIRRFALDDLGVDHDDLFSAAYWKAGRDSTAVDAMLLRGYQAEVASGADVTDPDVRDRVEAEI